LQSLLELAVWRRSGETMLVLPMRGLICASFDVGKSYS
jgi:hypothetical protein